MQTPRGLQPASLATILALLAIFLGAISYIRVSTQPRKRGSASRPRRGHRSPGILSSIPGASIVGRSQRKALLLALVAVLFVAAIAFAVSLNHASSSEGATLEVFWPREALNSQSVPLEVGRELEAIAKIINREKSSTNYTLKLKLNNSTLFTKDLNLGLNETWQGRLGFTLNGSPGLQRLELLLFRERDFSAPYREEHIEINLLEDASMNVSQNNSGESILSSNQTYAANSTGINATENSSPVSLEEKSRVTVLSAGGASSSSASVSATSTQSPSSAPAVQSQSTPQSATVSSSSGGTGSSSGASSAPVSASSTSQPVTKTESKTTAVTAVAKNTTISNQSTNKGAQNQGLQGNNSTNESAKSPSTFASAKKINATSQEVSILSAPSLSNKTSSTNTASFFAASVSSEKSTPSKVPSSPKASSSASFFAQPATTTKPTTSPESSKSSAATKSMDSSLSIGSTKEVSGNNNLSDQSHVDSIKKPQENLIPNLPPKLAGLNYDKSNPVLGSIVQWTANASDPENDGIYYKFMENGVVVNDWSLSNSWIWNTSTAAPGEHKIIVLARDGKHAAVDSFDDSMNATITLVAPNQPPVLKSLLPDKASPLERGTTVFWNAVALDPDNDKILYRFLINGKEARKWSKSNSWSWPTGNLPAGDYQITAMVIDGRHASEDSFDSIMNATMILSDPNHVPVLDEFNPDMDSPQAQGAAITWTANASDPDGDKVYYKFLANDKEMTDWSLSRSWIWNTSDALPGDYKITAMAIDGLHADAASFDSKMDREFTITSSDTIPNQIPLVQELNPNMISPQTTGAVITWTAIAKDPDGDKVDYRFLANDKEVTGWSPSNSWTWNTTGAEPADYKITVQVRDGLHADAGIGSFDSSKNAIFSLQASNQPPILKSLKADSSSPQVQGAAVLWKAEALDSDGDPVLYKFQVNGKDMNRWSESDSWKWSTKDLPVGDYKIRVLARDGRHAAEDSFDSFMETAFTLTTEIDQQIDLLMNQRATKSSAEKDYHSSDIQVAVANDTNSKAILGKGSGDTGKEKTDTAGTPRKLG